MKPETLRKIVICFVFLGCLVVGVWKIAVPTFEIPWGSLVLIGVALAGLTLLVSEPQSLHPPPSSGSSGTAPDAKVLFEDARERLMRWLRFQGLALSVFIGIAGFYVIKEGVRGAVDVTVAREMGHVEKEFDRAYERVETAKRDLDTQISQLSIAVGKAETTTDEAMAKVNETIEQASQTITNEVARSRRQLDDIRHSAQELETQLVEIERQTKENQTLAVQAVVSARPSAPLPTTVISTRGDPITGFPDVQQPVEQPSQQAEDLMSVLRQGKNGLARAAAARSLPDFPKDVERVVPALATALEDDDRVVRLAAADALRKVGSEAKQATQALIQALRVEDDDAAMATLLYALSAVEDAPNHVVPVLIELVRRASEPLRRRAIWMLARYGPEAKDAVPELQRIFREADDRDREIIASALGKIGAASSAAVPDLIAALDEQDIRVRRAIVRALSEIGDASAVPALERLQASAEGPFQSEVELAIARLMGVNDRGVKALVEALKRKDDQLRAYAINELARLVPDDPMVVEALRDVIVDEKESTRVRGPAVSALGQIGSEDAVTALKEVLLQSKSVIVRYYAVRALSETGVSTKDVREVLRDIADNDNSSRVRRAALEALEKMPSDQLD